MNACVDWPATLRRSSWRGVRFWVETDDLTVGRRLVVHQFPNRDRPFVEDLGEEAITYSVTAYVASDNALGEASALVRACRARGASTLVLPTEGAVQARCKTCTRTHTKDRMGLIAFRLEFVEAGTGLASIPVALLERLVGTAATSAIRAITSDFLAQYDLVRADSWVVSSVYQEFNAIVDTVDAVYSATHMQPGEAAAVGQLLDGFIRDANVLMADGRDSVTANQTNLGLDSLDVADGAFVTRLSGIFRTLRIGAHAPQDAYEAFQTIATYQGDAVEPVVYGVSGRQDAGNLDAMRKSVRRLALVEMAQAAAEADWQTRPMAITVRADVAELFERELHLAGGGEVYQTLVEVRGKASEAISKKLADKAPILTVETNASMPSIVVAHRLYNDASRASELVDINHIAHPTFMPATFEAPVAPEDETHAVEPVV